MVVQPESDLFESNAGTEVFKTLLERVGSEIRIIVGVLRNDRNIAGRLGEASCNAMNEYLDADDTWGRIGSNKCHAKAHLVVLSEIMLGDIKWHGGHGDAISQCFLEL